MTSSLRTYLLNTCLELGIEPIQLCDPSSEADLLTALLKEAINLREHGYADKSLGLLDAALEAGLSSDWIQDNRARGLIELSRLDEAKIILINLQTSANDAVRQAAESMLINSESDQMAPPSPPGNKPSDTVPETPSISGDSPDDAYIPEPTDPPEPTAIAELTNLLEKKIALRNEGDPQASVNLAEATSTERIAELPHQQLKQQLQASINELAVVHGWTLQHINHINGSIARVEDQILQEAITSREADSVIFSLELVELALQYNFNSPWLLDNKARALLLMRREQEAIAIWQQLSQKEDDTFLQEMAQNMLEQILAATTQDTSIQTKDAELDQNNYPVDLNQESCNKFSTEISAELKVMLDSAISLRNNGHPKASLSLLDDAVAHAQPNAWVEDNRARALINLGRDQEALQIWQCLSKHPDKSVAGLARQSLTQKKEVQALVNEVQASIRELSIKYDYTQQHLKKPLLKIEELKKAILKEAITARGSGHAEFSLAIIEQSLKSGLSSPWLKDNQARALINLDRDQEALQIWQCLTQHEDKSVADLARQALTQQAEAKALLNKVQANIKKLSIKYSYTPQHVRETFLKVKELEEAILKEAITSRESGYAEFSLKLVEQSMKSGLSSPWLKDNQARALMRLNQPIEAIAIWRELAKLAGQGMIKSIATEMIEAALLDIDPSVNAVTREQLTKQEKGKSSDEPLKDFLEEAHELQASIEALSIEKDYKLRHLRKPCLDAMQLEEAIGKEAIASRKSGHAGFSLTMLEQALKSGLSSPWLKDNQARALVLLNRKVEAVAIWRELIDEKSGSILQSTAAEMLETFGLDADRQERLEQAEQLITQKNQKDAIDLLTKAMLFDVEFNGYLAPLKKALDIEDHMPEDSDHAFDHELKEFELNLRAFDAYLLTVEQQVVTKTD